jgi:hypothetical protein
MTLFSAGEQIGGLSQILRGEFEERRLAGPPFLRFIAEGVVVEIAVLDGVVEDRGIGG